MLSFKKIFGKKELHEIVNIKVLKYIVKNWSKYEKIIIKNTENDYDYNPKSICKKYIAYYNKVISIKYNKSSKYSSKSGRWFCKGGIGIQSLPRVIRHTICRGLWIDLDFKNCHPVILLTLCQKHNIPCNFLTHYVNNRKQLLQEWSSVLNKTEEDIKILYLSALNGNLTHYNIANWEAVLEEFKNIHYYIANLPEYSIIHQEVKSLNSKNINAKTVNRILCIIENKCLETLFINLDKRDLLNVEINENIYKCAALIFDGMQIPLNEKTEEFITEQNLSLLSSMIFNETSFHLNISVKVFDEFLEIPDNFEEDIDTDDNIITDDVDAAEIILSKYGTLMTNCNNIKYINDMSSICN
jgi:hypothetical protein